MEPTAAATFSSFLDDVISLSHHCIGIFVQFPKKHKFIEVCRCSSALLVPPQYFSWVEGFGLLTKTMSKSKNKSLFLVKLQQSDRT